ncbi:hypothetical protein HC762_00325 [bacterium]|nr:hypothetical protein [bacterium]
MGVHNSLLSSLPLSLTLSLSRATLFSHLFGYPPEKKSGVAIASASAAVDVTVAMTQLGHHDDDQAQDAEWDRGVIVASRGVTMASLTDPPVCGWVCKLGLGGEENEELLGADLVVGDLGVSGVHLARNDPTRSVGPRK